MSFIPWPRTVGTGLVLLLSLSFPPRPGHAQEADKNHRVSLSIRVGVTLSTLRFQDPNANDQTRIRPGFHLGAGARIAMGRYAEAEGLLLYSQGGFGGRGGHPASLRTGYLELPLLVRARFPWQVSPHLVGGISPRIRVQCSLSDVGLVGNAGCDDPMVGTRWRRIDLAAIAGLGMGVRVGERRLLMEGTVEWGLPNVKADRLPPGWAKSADLRLATVIHVPHGGDR